MTNLLRQPNKQKAIDFALWLNFKHRLDKKEFGVLQSAKGDFLIVQKDHPTFKGEQFEQLPQDYDQMDYNHIQNIGMDFSPLAHFEELQGAFAIMDGELLRFILKYKIPLKKFIRHELACRGYDENHLWFGFEKAEEIWLK